MTKVTVTQDIDAPVEVVFRTVTDIENLPNTNEAIVRIDFLSEKRSGVGTRFKETRKMGKKEHVTELEITEFEENRHARMVADSHGTVWDTVFTVQPRGDGAHLEIAMDARAHKLLPKILNPIFKGMFRKGMQKHVQALAEYCEAQKA